MVRVQGAGVQATSALTQATVTLSLTYPLTLTLTLTLTLPLTLTVTLTSTLTLTQALTCTRRHGGGRGCGHPGDLRPRTGHRLILTLS